MEKLTPVLVIESETSVCRQRAVTEGKDSLCLDPVLCAPQTPRRQKRLFCRYHHGNRVPQLLIAPFKEEDEWDSPHIVRYYDVMSDEEIERIKEIAKPKVGVSEGPAGAAWGGGAVPPAASVSKFVYPPLSPTAA